MSEVLHVGAAWGCDACGAAGPLVQTACPACGALLPTVVLAGRRVGVQLYNEALAAGEAGFTSEALALLEEAIDAAGPDSGALALAGLLYHQAGRVAEAEAAWRAAGATGPWNEWAAAAMTAEADQRAIVGYNDALSLAMAGDWEQAYTRLGSAMGGECRLAQGHLLRGMAAWVLGRIEEARLSWQVAIALDPSVPGLQACLSALVEQMVGEAERTSVRPPAAGAEGATVALPSARRWIPLALALLVAAASAGTAYRYAALAERQTAEGREAAAAERSAREAAEQALREAQAAAQKAAEQVRSLEAAAAQFSAREAATLGLLTGVRSTDRAEEVERLQAAIAQAKAAGVSVPDWILNLGHSPNVVAGAVQRYFEGYRAFMADEYDRAIAAFDASLKLHTSIYVSDDAAYLAGRAAQLSNKPAVAASWYERLITSYPDSLYQDDAHFFGARAAAAAGDRERAIRWYRELLSRFPRSGYDWEAERALKDLNG